MLSLVVYDVRSDVVIILSKSVTQCNWTFFIVLSMENIALICTKFKYNLMKSEYQTKWEHSILLLYVVLLFDRAITVYQNQF